MRLFVFGGSQGAPRSTALRARSGRAAAGVAPARRAAPDRRDASSKRREAAYREAGIQADVRAFIDDMAAAYAEADLVVSRAGASTVAELAAAGVASILVPFPAAVDDHQTRNAAWLGRVSAAQVVSETGLTAGELANRLATLFATAGARLLAMAEAARALAVTDAAERVAGALPRGRRRRAHERAHAPRRTCIHLVGIGGAGMGGIAEVLRQPRLPGAGLGPARERGDARGSRRWACGSSSATRRRTSRARTSSSCRRAVGADNPELVGARRRAHPGRARAPRCSPS